MWTVNCGKALWTRSHIEKLSHDIWLQHNPLALGVIPWLDVARDYFDVPHPFHDIWSGIGAWHRPCADLVRCSQRFICSMLFVCGAVCVFVPYTTCVYVRPLFRKNSRNCKSDADQPWTWQKLRSFTIHQ